jgi:hypothetical protein
VPRDVFFRLAAERAAGFLPQVVRVIRHRDRVVAEGGVVARESGSGVTSAAGPISTHSWRAPCVARPPRRPARRRRLLGPARRVTRACGHRSPDDRERVDRLDDADERHVDRVRALPRAKRRGTPRGACATRSRARGRHDDRGAVDPHRRAQVGPVGVSGRGLRRPPPPPRPRAARARPEWPARGTLSPRGARGSSEPRLTLWTSLPAPPAAPRTAPGNARRTPP